jgi:energy-coupling factor transporter ATP-binding protein EcfA2
MSPPTRNGNGRAQLVAVTDVSPYVDATLEEALLGWAVWARSGEIAAWYDRLRPALVTDHRRRLALEAVRAEFAQSGTYDAGLLYRRLRAAGVGITADLLERWSNAYAAVPAGVTGLLEVLEDYAEQRAARGIRQLPPAPTGHASLRDIGDALEAARVPPPAAAVGLDTVCRDALHALDDPRPLSLRTGLGALDQQLGGFLPGQLVILGGHTGSGKTVLALRLGRGLAEQTGRPTYVHALEMTRQQLVGRLVADRATVENCAVQHAQFATGAEREAVARAYVALGEEPTLHLRDQSAGSSFPAALAAYDAWLAQHPDAVALVVDYVGLYREIPGAERRYQELGIVAHALKALAGRYGIVVLAVSQLSRAGKGEARPQLHHLRESGDLEQDADVVLLLYADDAQGADTLEVDIAKCRSGPAGTVVRLWFDRRYCRIEDDSTREEVST